MKNHIGYFMPHFLLYHTSRRPGTSLLTWRVLLLSKVRVEDYTALMLVWLCLNTWEANRLPQSPSVSQCVGGPNPSSLLSQLSNSPWILSSTAFVLYTSLQPPLSHDPVGGIVSWARPYFHKKIEEGGSEYFDTWYMTCCITVLLAISFQWSKAWILNFPLTVKA